MKACMDQCPDHGTSTHPVLRVAVMRPYKDGILTAFSGVGIYFSPDGKNLGGGGQTRVVYPGSGWVIAMIPYKQGVVTAFSGGHIYLSPDGENLGGGGQTEVVYSGSQSVVGLLPYGNGILTAFSPDYSSA
jgi:hypothetical protein